MRRSAGCGSASTLTGRTVMARRYWTWIACGMLLALSASTALADNGNGNTSKLKGTYTFRLVPATSFAPFVAGSEVETAPRQDILRVGVFIADGNGRLKRRTIATTDDGFVTIRSDFNWTGTRTPSTSKVSASS
jgi:hypothetical protein